MRPCSLSCLAVLAVVAAYVPAGGQAGQPTQPEPPAYRSTTRAVVVDVVVSKGDESVLGLHRQDFEVFEDGKAQTVDFFEEHSAKVMSARASAPLPQMPPGVYTNVPPAPQSDAVNVLLLDSLNTEKQDQSYVRQQILNFLQKMDPGTRAAIFTLGSKLRFIQGFTADTSRLLAAMNESKAGTPGRDAAYRSTSDTEDDRDEVKTMIMELGGHRDAGVDALEGTQSQYATAQYGDRINMTFEAIQAMARYLAAVPGRKNLLWFAGSYPVTVFPSAAQKQTYANQRGYLSQMRATADLLTISNVAVYPINAQGLVGMHVEGADQYDRPGLADYGQESADRAGRFESMEQLANDTGGKAFFNTNDLSASARKAIADGTHYYTLAYTPVNKKMDGSYRRIEVKVVEGKYRLAYRHGYNADDAARLVPVPAEANPIHELLRVGMPNATELLYAVRVLPAVPQPAANSPLAGRNSKLTGPTTRYSIDFMIRWTDLKLEATPDGSHNGKIQIELLAYDRTGKAVNWEGGTQVMNISPKIFAAIQRSGVPTHLEVDLPRDTDIDLETGVYDWATGRAGSLAIPIRREKPGSKAGAAGTAEKGSKRD